ncbi:MAG: Na+/H+ antiporter subunit E [Candidatus Vecturithrix sp.]|jgi:multicomponent Na+:H+ antiporter subunit E|nr:Na+/H+ antiporter subunit E [Candidatus Vecturithrix sp.]
MNLKTKWKMFRIGVTFFFLMLGWIIFTGNLDPQSLLLGAIFSFFIALLTYDYFVDETEVFIKDILPRPDIILLYLIILIAKVYIASFDVAYRVLTMKINPGEIRIRTRLRSELARVMLANSITITPGTLTIDLRDDYLYVHWLESKGTSALYAGELIKGIFEHLLRRIFR